MKKHEKGEIKMEILNTKEVANLLGTTKRTVERKAKNGEYPLGVCGKHGRFWLFNKEKLIQFVFNQNAQVQE